MEAKKLSCVASQTRRSHTLLCRSWALFTPILNASPGIAGRYDGNQAVVKGRNGNINNVIHVQPPQAKESADTEAPGDECDKPPRCCCAHCRHCPLDHPHSRIACVRNMAAVEEATQYGTAIETGDDLAKEPPLLPPQLQISLMNAPMDASEPFARPTRVPVLPPLLLAPPPSYGGPDLVLTACSDPWQSIPV